MRSAASRVGAVLLPDAPRAMTGLTLCVIPNTPVPGGMERDTTCESGTSDNGRAFRILDAEKIPRIAITTNVGAWGFARLARRGNRFFVLEPRVTRRKVGEATECECDGTPRPHVHYFYGFVVDDVPGLSVERLEVPVTEDVIEWECKSVAV